jgi:hypothetical protein
MGRPPWRGFGRAALVLLAAAAAISPLPAPLVERAYSASLFPRLQRIITSASNLTPFALLDALIVVTLGAWLIAAGMDVARRRRGWADVVARLMLRTIIWAACFYLVFLVVWGLNYRRVRLVDKLQFDARAVSQEAALAVADTTVGELNALHERAHEIGWPARDAIDPSLAAAFDRVQRELGVRTRAIPARPKSTWLDPYFRRAGVAGMTDPYFLETLAESDLLPFEQSFVIAHEWAHLAGFADESEANFVGWLTCLHGSIPNRYSGWLFLYEELSRAVGRNDRAVLAERLAPGPRADLRAIADRLQRQVNPAVSAAGWRVYDKYLKANRVQAGAASYADVVRLVLGVRFGQEWTPMLAASNVRR